ncbi:MAG: hypothetical protein ABIP17_06335 [Ilumatobacteraceae bacterium]
MTGAQGASTLIEVLDRLRDDGFAEQFIGQPDGTVRCTNCETRTSADELDVDGFHRLEGASDPSDENIVVWARCPSCGAGGALTIGYGTNSSDADQAVLELLDFDDVEHEEP